MNLIYPVTLRALSLISTNLTSHCQDNAVPSLYKQPLADRRRLLGLGNPLPDVPPLMTLPPPLNLPSQQALNTTSVIFPLGIIQHQNELFPVVHEEASVNAGATFGLKYLNKNFTFDYSKKDTLIARSYIPFDDLKRGQYSGQLIAEGIVTLHKIAESDSQRAVTNNKGIINSVFSFLFALYPTQAIELTSIFLDGARASGNQYKTNVKQYGPLIHWSIDNNKQRLDVTFELPFLTPKDSILDEAHSCKAREIIGDKRLNDPKFLQESIAKLAIASNFAAIRSIYYLGNLKHHIELHNLATSLSSSPDSSLIDATSDDRLDRLIECYVFPVKYPVKTLYVQSKPIAYLDLFPINDTSITLLNKATITIDLKLPVIISQVIFCQKNTTHVLNPDEFMTYLKSTPFEDTIYQEVKAYEQHQVDRPITRLEERYQKPVLIPGSINVQQLDSTLIRLNATIFTGETQGANRANAFAETIQAVMNSKVNSTGWQAVGGILSNDHTNRGPMIHIRIPKSAFTDLNIDPKTLIKISKQAQYDTKLAQKINVAALEGMFMTDFITGQDTRANIASFLFAATQKPAPGHARYLIYHYLFGTPSLLPFLNIEEKDDSLIITSLFPLSSARTAVGRVVNAIESPRISRQLMNIPVSGQPDGKVNQLDERACMLAVTKALGCYIELAKQD